MVVPICASSRWTWNPRIETLVDQSSMPYVSPS